MEVLQTVVEISKMNLVGTFKSPFVTTETQEIFLSRLKKKFTYRLTIIFSIGLESPDSNFRLGMEVEVIHDVVFSATALNSDNLYALYSRASLAVKEKVNEKLSQSGVAAHVDWNPLPKRLLEKKLDDAIIDMIYKETNIGNGYEPA